MREREKEEGSRESECQSSSSPSPFVVVLADRSLFFLLTVRIRVSRDEGGDGALYGITIDAAVARDVGEEGLDVR